MCRGSAASRGTASSAWRSRTDPTPTPPSDTSAFTDQQRAEAYPPGIERHYWLRCRNRIVYRELRRDGAAGAILDLGCGPGATVQHLRERGLDCRGCDLSPYRPVTPAVGAVIRYGIDAVDLPADERAAFGTLLLLDVLEHLREPAAFLRRAVAAFPHLRRVLITLPARAELWSNYDAFYGHQRRYDRAAATALAADAGLTPVRCRYFYHALYPVLALQRLLGVERGVAFEPVRGDAMHRLVAAGLYLDDLCLPGALPGTSVLVVARVGG